MICSKAMTEADETERAVLAANARFYRAFSEGDFAAMSELWASRSPVACLPPGPSPLLGLHHPPRRWRAISPPAPPSVAAAPAAAPPVPAPPRLAAPAELLGAPA